MKKNLILGSTSPYRKALLESTNIPFQALKPLCDEDALKETFNGSAQNLCMFLAKHKAESLSTNNPNSLIIGSDQALIFNNEALGKGKSFEGSFKQLSSLSGRTALLVTATYIHDTNGEDVSFECNTSLNFKKLSEQEITNYLHLDEPYDCAGSFKFEKNGKTLFTSVDTEDPTAIEGLPLKKLINELQKKGL